QLFSAVWRVSSGGQMKREGEGEGFGYGRVTNWARNVRESGMSTRWENADPLQFRFRTNEFTDVMTSCPCALTDSTGPPESPKQVPPGPFPCPGSLEYCML